MGHYWRVRDRQTGKSRRINLCVHVCVSVQVIDEGLIDPEVKNYKKKALGKLEREKVSVVRIEDY